MKKKKLLSYLLVCAGISMAAQDVHFSQLTETPLLLNPANSGLGHDVLAIINYKEQWKSVGAAYKTLNVSTDFAILKKDKGNRVGIGVSLFSDKAGEGNMGTTTGILHLSGVIAVSDKNLVSAGIYSGFGQRNLQFDKLRWDNQFDGMGYNPDFPSGEPATFANHNYLDIGAGFAWMYGSGSSTLSSNDTRRFSAGIAVHHLNKPVYSFYGDNNQRLPMKIVMHGNAGIGIKNYNLVLEPSFIVMIQGSHREITPGLMLKYITQEASKYTGRRKPSAFALGGYLRVGDALVACARYEISNWAIGTSYDINISDLKSATKAQGGFEVSLRFMFPGPFSSAASSPLMN